MYMAGYKDEEAFDRFAQGFRLDGREVKCPFLCIGGEDDELSPIEHTERLVDQIVTPKQIVIYQGERHAIGATPGGLGPNWMTRLADWLGDRADKEPMVSERIYVEATGRRHLTPA